jgi:dephospho-CoA kinase
VPQKWVLGLVGDVCAGKSTVARQLVELGALHFDADVCVHALYREPEVRQKVVAHFGMQVLGPDGQIDRKALGAQVFNDAQQLRVLTEEIVFPETGKRIAAALQDFWTPAETRSVFLLDAPTLFEAAREGLCQRILFVSAPFERRVLWAKTQRGWDVSELRRREARMMARERKLGKCSDVVDNAGSLDALQHQVKACWMRWQETSGQTGFGTDNEV